MLTRKKNIDETFRMNYYYNSEDIDESIINTYYETAHSGNALSKYLFASQCGHYNTVNISHCLKSLTNSIFIITGNGNPENMSVADMYKNILPSIEIEGVEETKHLPQLEKSSDFVDKVDILLGNC